MPNPKRYEQLSGFTIRDVYIEAGVTGQTVTNWLRGGARIKGHLIEAAIKRLKARRVAALLEAKARIEKEIEIVTSEI